MGCHGKHREARSARLAPRQKRGCSGGLIMLASAWKREASPVARGEIAGRFCGQVAGEDAWRLRWFGEGAGRVRAAGGACGAGSDTAKENDHSRPEPSHLSLSKVRGFFTACAWWRAVWRAVWCAAWFAVWVGWWAWGGGRGVVGVGWWAWGGRGAGGDSALRALCAEA
jgi:hypothetical protein